MKDKPQEIYTLDSKISVKVKNGVAKPRPKEE